MRKAGNWVVIFSASASMDAFDIQRVELPTAYVAFLLRFSSQRKTMAGFLIGEFTRTMLMLPGFIRRCFRHSGYVSSLCHPEIWLH